ncbi:2-hydroxyacid dehydrogenase [Variovorax sp. J22R133]|uniref:2-hydroxyacid dehydrogenase n=1 Tax=Variovorax brevis TaxID=3053503 RepID=UPI002575B89E|nr:2-hydroxyacid dehydrogenase [Variovorax sp. J22R133]MDM0110952.1 2-hydroxyacid dehydrogenase [Variovorax sp. J22R133]
MPTTHILAMANAQPMFIELLTSPTYTVHRQADADFATVAPQIRAIAAGGESKIDAALQAQLPALEIISVMGVGYDGIDVAAAKAKGAVVTHTPNVLNDDVADLAMALMLAWARQIPKADQFIRNEKWLKGGLPLGRKVSGARLGIVGMGRIGQAIGKRAEAFGMSIAYTSRSAKDGVAYAYVPSAAALAAQSDFLVIITPGGAATRKLIDAEVLKALGPQGCVVNVARGSVIDETALIEALRSGTIAGAALDVFENEPNVPQALREMDNVVLSPHIGSATTGTRRAMAELALSNLTAHLAGQPLPTPVPECQ